jgi:hypothetical protein
MMMVTGVEEKNSKYGTTFYLFDEGKKNPLGFS